MQFTEVLVVKMSLTISYMGRYCSLELTGKGGLTLTALINVLYERLINVTFLSAP